MEDLGRALPDVVVFSPTSKRRLDPHASTKFSPSVLESTENQAPPSTPQEKGPSPAMARASGRPHHANQPLPDWRSIGGGISRHDKYRRDPHWRRLCQCERPNHRL